MVKTQKIKVSIIVPVYNVEKYLEMCIKSILHQDVGRDHIELVLVNDGSKDNSGKICQKFADMYPESVVYIDQKNAGVSEARNTGIRAATGDYIGFVDSDDYISKNAVRNVIEYFKKHSDADVATIRVIQFGYYNAERSVDLKFSKGTRTINLKQPQWYDVQPRVAPAFIRASVAKRHSFNKHIGIYEDTRYMADVLSEKMKLGVVYGGSYYNRIHYGDANASITTGATKEKRFYLDSPKNVSLYILQEMRTKKELAPQFFQYMALYEMRWRLFHNSHNPKNILSKPEYDAYKKVNRDILALIDDQSIIDFKMFTLAQRIFLLNMKYDTDVTKQVSLNEDGRANWKNVTLFDFESDMTAKITDVHLTRSHVTLRGYFSMYEAHDMHVELRVDGDYRPEYITFKDDTKKKNRFIYDRNGQHGRSFIVHIPVISTTVQSIDFVAVFHGSERLVERFSLTSRHRHSFGYRGDYKIGRKIGGITIYPVTNLLLIRRAIAAIRYLLKLIGRAFRKAKKLCIQMIKMLR